MVTDAPALIGSGETLYVDDMYFSTVGYTPVTEPPVVEPSADPTTSAPAPTHDATDDGVVSLYSDTYTDVTAGTWRSQWSGGSDHSVVDLGGNSVHKYENMNFAIIENFDQIDASEKGTFHVTVWRTGDAADTVLGVKLVDYPTGAWTGNDPEHEFTFDVSDVPAGQWVTLALPLADATGLTSSANIAQVIVSSKVPNPDYGVVTDAPALIGSGETLYVDDMYFSTVGYVTPIVNDHAPDFDHDTAFLQQYENIDTTQVIWNASATDADGDDVTYSLGGNDADAFDIDEDTGAVTFAESPDYESGVTSYDFTITASDGSLTDEQAVTVQISNVVEQYTLDPADLASGGEFVGEAMDDRMDGRGATSALELSGGAGTDVLYGGDAGDILDGGDGNDQLSGGGGDDVLIAGTGVDRIDGGDGIDTVVLDSEDGDFVSVNLSREWQYSGDGWNQIVNVENVVTGGGADIIKGNDIGNVVESGAGNDWVYANGGDDVLIGGEGIDRLFGGDGNDTVLYETDENLVIDLNSEWQLSNGETSEGIDKLIDIENVTTGSGEDVLIGNDGANVLTGGDGDDTLTGGDGADVFRFYSSEGVSTDVITDFTVGEDSIELIDDTTGEVAQAQITTDASGSTVTWDELTIVLDVNVNYDDINPITD